MLTLNYNESRGNILVKYDENFGRVCEVDVTDQALQAVFRYLMAHGLSLAEHCEYEVDGNKFRTSLVKEEPTAEWVEDTTYCYLSEPPKYKWRCSNCGFTTRPIPSKPVTKHCPKCMRKMV